MAVPFGITRFLDGYWARDFVYEEKTHEELADMAEATEVDKKEDQHLLVPARFGRIPSPPDPKTGKSSGSYKHGGNLIEYNGWAVDIDAGGIELDEIKARLDVFGISFSGWSTWSSTSGAPRSRLFGEFSSAKSHAGYVPQLFKLNSAVGGLVAPESGAIAQGMLVGRRKGAIFARVTGDGDVPLDLIDERDIGLLPFAKTKVGNKTTPNWADLTEVELKEQIGLHYFHPINELARRYARQDIPQPDTVANLSTFVDQVDVSKRDRKWSKARASISRWVADAYAFIAKKKGTHLRALVAHLSDDPLWRGVIKLNEFTRAIEVARPFPPVSGVRSATDPRPLREVDVLEALLFLQGNGFPKATITDVWRAVTLTAEHSAFHPVRDFFARTEWDETPRLHRLFSTSDFFPPDLPSTDDGEARDNMIAYLERIGPCFMVAAVARIYEPGCKVDTVPVLVSPESFDKSKGLRALVPDPSWFTDDISTNLIDRDTKESLTGKLIIELAEIPHIRHENEKVKAFFSRGTDRYRAAYGRANEDHPRQGVFVGTSNRLELLSETGNRRFWPIPLAAPVNVARIIEDRGRLWAEAVHLYLSGFEWWLPPKLELLAGLVQAAYIEADPWDELIVKFLDSVKDAASKHEPFTLKEVVEGIGFRYRPGEREMPSRADELRVARRLRVLGFHPDPHRHRSAGRLRFWVEIPKRST